MVMDLRIVGRTKNHVFVDTSSLTKQEKKWLMRESRKHERKQFRKFKRAWKWEHQPLQSLPDLMAEIKEGLNENFI